MRLRHYDTRDLNCLACIGDSITSDRVGSGTAMADTYCYKIAGARGYARKVNAGLSGDTTTGMLARFQRDVLNYRPGAVSIMGGTNDFSSNISGSTWVGSGTSAATMKANLKAMILAAQNIGAKVTLCTPIVWRLQAAYDHYGPFLTAMSEAASETGAAFFDVYTRFLGLSGGTLDTLMLGDNVHPNVAGHAYIADMAAEGGFASCFTQPSPR